MAYKAGIGIQVDRAASIIPQTVATPGTAYFTVAGGLVLITGLVGYFTVIPGAICNATWCFDPTVGTDTDVCSVTAIGGAAAGDLLSVSGVVTESMLPLAGSAAQLLGGIAGSGGKGIVVPAGSLGVFTNASVTGNWVWILWYIPVDDAATVVAA